jgi:prohibitin 1
MLIFSLNFYRRKFYQLINFAEHHMLFLLFIFALFFGSLIVLWPRMFVAIPAGSVGTIYRPLSGGVDMNVLYKEGYFLVWPWNSISIYTTRIQFKQLDLELLTADLLRTKVTVAFQYEANPITVPMLHKFVGKDYLNILVIPQIISVARDKVAQFSSKMAYTSDLSQIASDIAITTDNLIISKLSPTGLSDVRLVRVSSVQLLDVRYPQDVQQAIQNKIVEAEIADAYKYKIQAALQEAVRKEAEASGIREFQRIVNDNMTQNYLIFRGIEATEELAKSSNAKTLVFGSGPSGLPLILGNAVDSPASLPSLMKSTKSDQATDTIDKKRSTRADGTAGQNVKEKSSEAGMVREK